ncbi:P44-57 outer membrane protein, silent, partial [Anaplasma phagocytophilum str. HZ]
VPLSLLPALLPETTLSTHLNFIYYAAYLLFPETLASMPVTCGSLGIPRASAITLIMQNKTKGIRDSGSKEDEADTVYLLAKELAYDVVTGQTDKLTAALAKTSGKDIVQFAKAVEISAPNIDKKVCVTKRQDNASSGSTFAKYGTTTQGSTTSHTVSVCGGEGVASTGHSSSQELRDFIRETLKEDGNGNWPTSKGTESVKPASKPNDNAQAVAKDLVALNSDEKTIVAGLLAKTIEGGEVVEIRAVSSTFRESLTIQSSEVTFEYSVKYQYVHYI